MSASPLTGSASGGEACRACGGPVLSAAGVGATCRCEGCLIATYCSRECQQRDRRQHRPDCPTMAVSGFEAKLERLAGGTSVSSASEASSSGRHVVGPITYQPHDGAVHILV